MSRLRVLLLAELANPELASVPLVGWSQAAALREVCDAHLVTQVRNRDALVRAGLREGCDFTAIDSELVAAASHRLAYLLGGRGGRGWTLRTASTTPRNWYFEKLVWEQFGQDLRRGRFDLVHRITPLSPTVPSLITRRLRRAGIPFVLGPLNGGLPWPREFDGARRAEFEWLSYVRGVHKVLPGYRATRCNAAAILIASRATWEQMPSRYHHKCFYLPENAIDPARFTARRREGAEGPLRVIYLGRLVPYKGADMLLEAAEPLLKAGSITLRIVGQGPLETKLREMVARQGVEAHVTFEDWVAHDQVQYCLADADIMALPSIREFGGGVVLEAMAVGTVPLVVDYGGPGELVTPETGLAVPLGQRAAIVASLRSCLRKAASEPERVEHMSNAALTRAHNDFTWHAKAEATLRVYNWVRGGTRPQMPLPRPSATPGAD